MDAATLKIVWPNAWGPVDPEHARWAEVVVRREIYEGHPLFGRNFAVIGKSLTKNDYFLCLDDAPSAPPKFAVVHPTFTVNHGPELPQVLFFDTLGDWIDGTAVSSY